MADSSATISIYTHILSSANHITIRALIDLQPDKMKPPSGWFSLREKNSILIPHDSSYKTSEIRFSWDVSDFVPGHNGDMLCVMGTCILVRVDEIPPIWSAFSYTFVAHKVDSNTPAPRDINAYCGPIGPNKRSANYMKWTTQDMRNAVKTYFHYMDNTSHKYQLSRHIAEIYKIPKSTLVRWLKKPRDKLIVSARVGRYMNAQ